jgi:hypothetical protein
MAGTGSFLGLSRTSGLDGGVFNLREQRVLSLQNSWIRTIPTSGLQLYLDASNEASYSGSGNTWNDLSGNGRNFTWGSASFNSSGIKYFNTSGRLATGPASNSFGITNTSGYTFFITVFQNSLTAQSAFKWYSSNGSGSAGRGIFSHLTWVDSNIYWDQGGCCNSDTRTVAALTSPTGTWHVIAFRNNYAATNRTTWRNNSILTTNTSGIANINLSATAANIGNSDEGSSWDARIGQFMVYNRSLSDTEMTEVYTELRAKVGI